MYSGGSPKSRNHWPRKTSKEIQNHRSFYTQSVSTFDFDDNNDETFSQSFNERNNSVLLKESFGKSLIGDYLGGGNKVMEKKKIADADIKFAEKSTWKKSLVCRVCRIDVDKKGSRHHCRICASTVCGSCSERKINEKRVCDICFFRANTQHREKLRENTLAEKSYYLKKKKEELLKEQRNFEMKKTENSNLVIEHKNKEEQEEINKEKFRNERSEVEKALNTTKDLNNSLASNIKRHQALIDDKESQLKGIQTKLSALKLEMAQKIKIYKKLQIEFQTCLSKKDSIQEVNVKNIFRDRFFIFIRKCFNHIINTRKLNRWKELLCAFNWKERKIQYFKPTSRTLNLNQNSRKQLVSILTKDIIVLISFY